MFLLRKVHETSSTNKIVRYNRLGFNMNMKCTLDVFCNSFEIFCNSSKYFDVKKTM